MITITKGFEIGFCKSLRNISWYLSLMIVWFKSLFGDHCAILIQNNEWPITHDPFAVFVSKA